MNEVYKFVTITSSHDDEALLSLVAEDVEYNPCSLILLTCHRNLRRNAPHNLRKIHKQNDYPNSLFAFPC